MKIIILAAGMGSRLGNVAPKPLTKLKNGHTIMSMQLDNLSKFFDINQITLVLGYKKEEIMEAHSNLSYVYNPRYKETNTSKSLLHALSKFSEESILWLNGDVVFESDLLNLVIPYITKDQSFVCVNNNECGDEEVKYTLSKDNYIDEISKTVENAIGEAVGINFISKNDLPFFIERLKECNDNDYFERGIELMIEKDKRKIKPIDISEYPCLEVDFQEDLQDANKFL